MTAKTTHWTLRSVAPFIALALAVLPAAWPYFGEGIPRTNDALPHLYRALALDRLVRQGILWPRWSPDLAHGYGYPVFNFLPALSHYLVVLYHLFGLPLTLAYRATVLTHFILAACFAYLLGRDLYDPDGSWLCGWIVAIAYVYSPYFLYDTHVRGSLQETQALALLPLLFFTLRRATLRGGRWIAMSALAFALTFLSHIALTFQSIIPLGIFLLGGGGWAHACGYQAGWRQLWKPLVGLALGVLLTTFFWLPVLDEMDYVQSAAAIARGYPFAANFLTIRELLAWPRLPADPALVNPPVVRALPQVALALAALVLPVRWRRLTPATRRQTGLLLSILGVCTVLITPLSRLFWDVIPLLKLTQFPWRLLGPASLAGACLVAAPFANLSTSPRRLTLAILVVATILIGSIPWLYPPREDAPESPTLAHLIAFEHPPHFIGTTTLGEFLPIWVDTFPDTPDLRQTLATGKPVDRLVAVDGVTIQQAAGSPLDAAYVLHAERPTTLTYRQFYYPGWKAEIDGQPIELNPGQPDGLLQMAIPAGQHRLTVTFGATPARTLGEILSALTGIVLVVVIVFGKKYRHLSTPDIQSSLALPGLAILVASILGIKLFFDTVDTPLRHPTTGPGGLHHVQNSLALDFAGELRLLGYEQPPHPISADDDVLLTLYWQPLRPIGVRYDVVAQIIDQDDLVWSTPSTSRPSDWRWAPGTADWRLDRYVMDPYILQLLDGAPPGEYAFRVSLVRHDTKQTVDTHRIGRLMVTQPTRGDRPLEEEMTPLDAPQQTPLIPLGSRIDRRQAAPGDPVRVTMLWQVRDTASTPPFTSSPSLTLNLVARDGTLVFTATTPVAPHYPSTDWQPGDRLRTEVLRRLPAHTPPGEHTWQARIDQMRPITLPNTLLVRDFNRQWTPPGLAISLNAHLNPVATLLGVDVEPPSRQIQASQPITVTLAWQAKAETTTSYHVFLHLTATTGDIVAQKDGEPANWTRPTTGWLPGEVVIDEHILHLPAGVPPGVYALRCGLYDPGTGRRLTTPTGADAIPIQTIFIETAD